MRQSEEEEEEEEIQPQFQDGGITPVQRQVAGQEEEELLQAKTVNGPQPSVSNDLTERIQSLRRAGQLLQENERAFFEPRFGHNFGSVRIHCDSRSAEIAKDLNARAFTIGHDIVFGKGQYIRGRTSNNQLLAHELTHVVQQSGVKTQSPMPQTQATNSKEPHIQRLADWQCTLSNCRPRTRCATADNDFKRAQGYLAKAITAMSSTKPKAFTQRALRWYFKRRTDTPTRTIYKRLKKIDGILRKHHSMGFFRCARNAPCQPDDYALTLRKGPLSNRPIYLCTRRYFSPKTSDEKRAAILIHEGAHLSGLSLVRGTDVYGGDPRFPNLTSAQALRNADSFALFAKAIGTNRIPVSFVPGMGLRGGAVIPGRGRGVGWYGTFYVDLTLQHPRLLVFNPFLRTSISLLGIPAATTRQRSKERQQRVLLGLLGGIRIKNPRPAGTGISPYLSLYMGMAQPIDRSKAKPGLEVGAAAGFRWKILDLSLGASYLRMPKQFRLRNLYKVGAAVSLKFDLL
jgi:hypothetical protein